MSLVLAKIAGAGGPLEMTGVLGAEGLLEMTGGAANGELEMMMAGQLELLLMAGAVEAGSVERLGIYSTETR